MSWLVPAGWHIGHLARGLDRLGITDADWTAQDLITELGQWRATLGTYAIPPSWQHSPIGLLLHELRWALAPYLTGTLETPGARRRRIAAQRAAENDRWRADLDAAEAHRATPEQVQTRAAAIRDQLRRTTATNRPTRPGRPPIGIRPRAW